MQDLATRWIQSYPCKTETSQKSQKCLLKSLEPTRKPKVIYTDNSLEFGKACEELTWNHCTSTPHRSETNGIDERAVRRVKERDICSIVAIRSGRYLRNIQDLLSNGKRHPVKGGSVPFNGLVIPFGAMVEYHPVSAKDLSRLHQFGSKVFPRNIFR